MRRALATTGFVLLVAIGAACSSSSSPPDSTGDCVSVCNGELTRSCTTITDCTSYCDAIEGVANAGNCVVKINAYIACAKSAAICGVKSSCGDQNSDFSSCAANYCDANTTDTDCDSLSDTL